MRVANYFKKKLKKVLLPRFNAWVESNPNMGNLNLNIKNFGYSLSRDLAAKAARGVDISKEPSFRGLGCKPTTQSDMESPWFHYWCNQLHATPIFHRKLWEYAFVLQALYDSGLLEKGKRGIGFGCGEEPLASFFASRELQVLVTDLSPEKSQERGWIETSQHATSIMKAFYPDIVDKRKFDEHVKHQFLDMNHIPEFLEPFDFCWSICAFEHVGSIKQGLDFVENSLKCLLPGGLAVHTTEFNFGSTKDTIEDGPTVLFLQTHFEELAKRLQKKGHKPFKLDFEVGSKPLDQFIDLPPYKPGAGFYEQKESSFNQAGHLKLAVGGFPSTCYGLIIQKGLK